MFIPLHDDNSLDHIARPYVNYALIGLTLAVYALTGPVESEVGPRAAFSFGIVPSELYRISSQHPGLLSVPEPMTLVTYAFVHANLWHLIGNMLFLWVFGDNIEDAVGHWQYGFFYRACAAGGGLAHSLSDPESLAPMIGASGAVAGIVAAYLLLHPHVKLWVLAFGRIPLRLSAGIVLLFWLGFQLASLVISLGMEDQVAWWAHMGGFTTGALLILVLRRPGVPLFDRGMTSPQN